MRRSAVATCRPPTAGATHVAGDDEEPAEPEPVVPKQIVPEVAHEQQQEHGHRDRRRQVMLERVRPRRVAFRARLRIHRRFDDEAPEDRPEREHARAGPSRRRPGRTGCATPACSPSRGRHEPGPMPVAGCAAISSIPLTSPSSRPSPETRAFSGPTSGFTIVSNRVCSESGSARNTQRGPDHGRRDAPASDVGCGRSRTRPTRPARAATTANRSSRMHADRQTQVADERASRTQFVRGTSARTPATNGRAKTMLAPKLFGSPSERVDADHPGDAHAVRVPPADVLAQRVQHVDAP